jgi:hypothetical protein
MKREAPAGSAAEATRKQLECEYVIEELEPGVLQVVTLGGRRLRWCKVFGRDLYRLTSAEEAA